MDNYDLKNISMEWWRWSTYIKALKTEKYQLKEGGKKKKNIQIWKYRPKEGDKKKTKKTFPTDRPMFWHPKGNATSFYFRPKE